MKKAQAEVDSVLGQEPITYEAIKELEYATHPPNLFTTSISYLIDLDSYGFLWMKACGLWSLHDVYTPLMLQIQHLLNLYDVIVAFLFRYLRLIVVESLRLYPQPPLLIRRSLKPDKLPGMCSDYMKSKKSFDHHFLHVFFYHSCKISGRFIHSRELVDILKRNLNDAGGYNGNEDGYSIPAGTDLFVSVSIMQLVFWNHNEPD